MKIIGIDIGGTKSGVTLADYINGEIQFLGKTNFPTFPSQLPKTTPSDTIKQLLADTRNLLQQNNISISDISVCGINCGGPLNAQKGVILCPPNLPGWIDVPIVKIFEDELGLPCYLQNDANAGAIAEHLFGAGKGFSNVIFLTHGTGMGAGFILNEKLYSGTNDMAGEVGHLRLERFGPVGFGKSGSFEGFCSGGGIAKLAQNMALEKLQIGGTVGFCSHLEALPSITAKTVAEAAHAGDDLAREVFEISGKYLGRALSLLIDILNPQRILLGSIYGHCRNLLYDTMMAEIFKETISFSREVCEILPCGLGEKINDYEAISIGVYNMRVWAESTV